MKELVTATIALLLSLFFGLTAPSEEEAVFRASGDRAKEYITYLASDELQGRQTCTEGYRRAADWVAMNFEAWGLSPAGENETYFQNMSVREFTWNTGVPSLAVGEREFLLDDGDFSMQSVSTAGTKVRAEVVFVGYGISAAEKGLDEYAGVDVTGKVALVLKGSPHTAPQAQGWFSPDAEEESGAKKDPWIEEAKDAAKIKTAYDRGAAAILVYDPDPPEDDGRRYWSRSREAGLEAERDFLAFTVEKRIFRAIMKGDPQESPGGFRKRLDVMRRAIKTKEVCSQATGVEATLAGYVTSTKHCEEAGNNVARNVIAKIPGTDPELKDQYVIVGGHLDHVGMRDGYIRNGADDNASGTACVMEAARVLAEGGFAPKRTMIFCCWAGEEMGLLGSRHYAENPCDGVSLDRTVTYFNADMVGLGNAIGAPGALNFPSIWEVIKKDQDPTILDIVEPSLGGPGGSDHSAFITEGIEALALMTSGGGGHPHYHQPEDDAALIESSILGQTTQFVVQGMMNLANETETNLLIENRKVIYEATRLRVANFNPALEDSSWEVVELKDKSAAKLRERIDKEMMALLKGKDGSDRPSRSVTRGVTDLAGFGGDVELLDLAATFYGFGRLDIAGDDGTWIVDGRLSRDGRTAVRALEKAEFLLHLVSPSEELLGDFISAAGAPFLVTGTSPLNDALGDRLADKGVLLGIDFDPAAVDDCIARLEEAKELVGRRDLLVLHLTSTEGLDEGKSALYLGLLEKGWAAKEIAGGRRSGAGIAGGNLRVVGANPVRSRRR